MSNKIIGTRITIEKKLLKYTQKYIDIAGDYYSFILKPIFYNLL